MPKKAATKPSFFLQLQKKNLDTSVVMTYLIKNDLIEIVEYNGSNSLNIKIKGEPKRFIFDPAEAQSAFAKLRDVLGPKVINIRK